MTDQPARTPYPNPVDYPTLHRVAIVDPTRTVYGEIDIRYTRNDAAYVNSTRTHLTHRGNEISGPITNRGYMELHRTGDAWEPDAQQSPYFMTEGRYPVTPTPPAVAADLIAAIIGTVAHHWSPEVGRAADYADATHALRPLALERDSALAELARIDAARAPYLATVAAYKAPAT